MTDVVDPHEYGVDTRDGQHSSASISVADRVQYDEATDTYTLTHDWNEDTSISTTVILAIEALEERDCQGPRLVNTIDPDALDSLFTPSKTKELSGHVSFSFDGYEVTVDASGTIELDPS